MRSLPGPVVELLYAYIHHIHTFIIAWLTRPTDSLPQANTPSPTHSHSPTHNVGLWAGHSFNISTTGITLLSSIVYTGIPCNVKYRYVCISIVSTFDISLYSVLLYSEKMWNTSCGYLQTHYGCSFVRRPFGGSDDSERQ